MVQMTRRICRYSWRQRPRFAGQQWRLIIAPTPAAAQSWGRADASVRNWEEPNNAQIERSAIAILGTGDSEAASDDQGKIDSGAQQTMVSAHFAVMYAFRSGYDSKEGSGGQNGRGEGWMLLDG